MKPVSITEWGHTIMTYEPKRARRRRDLARMKAKAKRIAQRRFNRTGASEEWVDEVAYRIANHLAVCSCDACRPGAYGILPAQTLRFLAEPVELE